MIDHMQINIHVGAINVFCFSIITGHLMGKKSIESLPEPQETILDNDYLTPPETAGVTELDLYERLMQQKTQKQMNPQTTNRLLRLGSNWREENRDKYLREVSEWILHPYLWVYVSDTFRFWN